MPAPPPEVVTDGPPREAMPATGRRPLAELVGPGWDVALAPVADRIASLGDFLRDELSSGRAYLPEGSRVLRAFGQPFDGVRVLVVGQDPYPTPGHPVGLSFAVAPDVRPIPRSLVNIFREYSSDLGLPTPRDGDLTPWADRGVLLLNRVLTVRPGAPGSHRNHGWEVVTETAVRALAARDQPMVAILWGRDAQSLRPLLTGPEVAVIASAHPSPMSADRGFFGSRPFSRANEHLVRLGAPPVEWRLPS